MSTKSSYWYIDENQTFKAVCIECSKKYKDIKFSFFWPAEKGYGDYDLTCSCGEIIHIRKEINENN